MVTSFIYSFLTSNNLVFTTVRVTLNSLRSRWAGVPKILVNIECAQNLPRMDGFLGMCMCVRD
jgi:hypothetical protein